MVDFSEYDSIDVTVWLREDEPAGIQGQSTLLSRLRRLESEGAINDLTVNRWCKQLECDPDVEFPGSEVALRERIDEFKQWAEARGHSLEPAFRWCEKTSLVSDDSREYLVLPVVCLEVRSNDRLLAVFPCTSGTETNTALNCVTQLEALSRDDAIEAEGLAESPDI